MDTVYQNCVKMLQARKYKNITTADGEITAVDTLNRNVMVLFLVDEKLNINAVKESIKKFAENDVKLGILIYTEEPTSSAKKTLTNLENSGKLRITTFPLSNFRYCLTDHRLVRPHTKVKKDLATSLKQKYGADKLPIILHSDPVVRYYNFRAGDILAIKRADNTVSYRIVR